MATSVSQPGMFTLQAFTDLGALMASGRLYTYTQGTTTKKVAYTEATGTTAHTYTSDGAGGEYIALNARGELPAPLYLTAGAYDITLKTAAGATVWTRRADPTGDFKLDMAASGGAALVGFIYSGSGAVATTLQAIKRSSPIDAKLFAAATFDGSTNDTDAVQAAITAGAGGMVYIPKGTAKVGNLTVPDNTTVYGCGAGSVLKKNANGPLITLGKQSRLVNFRLDGDGANFTGQGVLIDDAGAATIDTGWQRSLYGMEIQDMEGYCVEFENDSDGYGSEMIGGVYTRTVETAAVAAVKFPSTETNGNRRMIGVFCFGNAIADLAASDNTLIQGCEGSPPLMTANTLKARVIGNRLAGSGGATIDGQLGVYANNSIAHTAWTLSATLTNTTIEGNNWPGGLTLTDSVPVDANNYISMPRQVYTPTWGSGGATDIGNGTLNASYIYDGDTCRGNIQMTIGSTTNVGSGAWTFSLPKQAARNSSGSCYIEDATGPTVYAGVSHIVAGASVVRCAIAGSTAAYMGSATPITWAVGDKIEIDFDYQVD